MLQAPTDPHGSERSPQTAQAAMLEALLAGQGLERVAAIAEEHVLAPVRIYVPRPGSDGADGAAPERYVAALVAGGDPIRPSEIADLAPIVSGGELQGAVVMLGEGEEEADRYLGAAATAALTGVAMLNAREEAAGARGDRLLAELLSGRPVPPGEVVRRARLRGCDLSGGLTALCLNPGETSPSRLLAALAVERPDALAEPVEDRVLVLLPGPAEAARELAERLGERAVSAFSSHYRQAADASRALAEAELLLTLVEAGGRRSSDRPTWETVRLLFRYFAADPEELAEFSERTVGPVIRHDREQGSELEATFWAYQESNCNMNLTAKATYAHRHTIANRLARIEELTGLDPNRSWDRELLSLGLTAHLVVSLARRRKQAAHR